MNFKISERGSTIPEVDRVYGSALISESIKQRICVEKGTIDPVYKEWDKIKRSLHNYEYIYTSSTLSKNVAHINPVSRSYFKMKEMIQACDISVDMYRIACLAEAPGGFIQSLLEENISEIHGVTLVSEDPRVPYWNRGLREDPRVVFQFGSQNNGDLYDFKNIVSLISHMKPHSMDLVTGDGGFDNSHDYNRQEINSLRLIYSEIYLALHLQALGGTFICKVFDTFEAETIMLLYILSCCYETLDFYKPSVSRISNSEKYVVCKGYKGYSVKVMNHMTHHFTDTNIDVGVPREFMKLIHDFNETYAELQINTIQKGLQKIKKRDYHKYPSTFQIQIAKQWCETYKVPINHSCRYLLK